MIPPDKEVVMKTWIALAKCWAVVVVSLLIAGAAAATEMSNFSNIRIHPNLYVHQSEMSIAVNPLWPNYLLVGANVAKADVCDSVIGGCDIFWTQCYYYSTDAGANWEGSDTIPSFSASANDPAVVYDTSGNAYFGMIPFAPRGVLVSKSDDTGRTFDALPVAVSEDHREDKEHFVFDVYRNYLYCAWVVLEPRQGVNHQNISFARSVDGGEHFIPDPPINISDSIVSQVCLRPKRGARLHGSADPWHPCGNAGRDQ